MASFRLHCLPPPPVLLVSVLLCLCAAAAASSSSYSSSLSQKLIDEYRNHTGISDFRLINRRVLGECLDPNPYLAIHVDAASPLPDEANVTVTISGVLDPDKSDWVAMITPTDADVNGCALSSAYYIQTGDLSNLPLLCQYPVKAQYLSSDPGYLGCKKQECRERVGKECLVRTCNASVTFHVINFRTDIEFVFFTGGFDLPCVLRRSQILSFSNPDMPLYGHLSSVDSSGTSPSTALIIPESLTLVFLCGRAPEPIPAFKPSSLDCRLKRSRDLMMRSLILLGRFFQLDLQARIGHLLEAGGAPRRTRCSSVICGSSAFCPYVAMMVDKNSCC